MKKNIFITLILTLFFIQAIHGKNDTREDSDESTEVSAENRKDKKESYFFTISPGLNFSGNTLRIKEPSNTVTMVQKDELAPSLFLDFRSMSYPINNHFGVYLWIKNSSFLLDRQILPVPGVSSSSISDEEDGSSSTKPTTYRADTGTSIKGEYNALLPSIYWQVADFFQAGVGAGYSRIQLNGNYQSQLKILPVLSLEFINQGKSIERLDSISLYYLSSGLASIDRGDRVFTYLISNLSSPGFLNLTGLYLLANGHKPQGQNLFFMSLYLISAKRQGINLSLTEAYALSALATTTIREKEKHSFTWTLFFDFKVWKDLHINSNFMQSSFHRSNRKFHFDTIELNLYYELKV